MPQKQPDNQDAVERIRSGCERNVPIEIHTHTDDTTPAARARMLFCDEERVYLDKPQSIGQDIELSESERVEAYFTVEGELYAFSTTVARMACRIRLNSDKVVEGMALTLPASVKQGQRRGRYRTSLAFQDPIPTALIRADADEETEPAEAERYEGRLVDASDTGFGVLIDEDIRRRIQVLERWRLRFCIPGASHETVFLCEVRQVRAARDGTATKIGLMTLTWPSEKELRQKLMPLTRYLTSVERELRKRAG